MHKWSPGRPVAHDQYMTGRGGMTHEVVHHEVRSEARRSTEDGGVPEEGWAEPISSKLGDVALHQNLRGPVRSHGIERGVFGQHLVRCRRPIEAARRGEYEALDAHLLS